MKRVSGKLSGSNALRVRRIEVIEISLGSEISKGVLPGEVSQGEEMGEADQ